MLANNLRHTRQWAQQQAALATAVADKDRRELQRVIREAVAVRDKEWGYWPDNWSAFQRALDEVLPWNEGAMLEDVAYGRVDIAKEEARG